MLLPGIFRFAKLVRILPASLMIGFCNGLALSMVIHQIPSFRDETGEFVTGLRAFYTAIICVVSYAIMMLLPYFTEIIPSAFVAVVVGTIIQYACRVDTVTIGDLYDLHGKFPPPTIPDIAWTDSKTISDVMVAAILTAIISCVESFMSDAKITQLTETPTNFERESISLGVAHIVNGFFSGMPGCVVYGPCILNIECGSGTRRLSGFICAVLMVIIPLALFAVIRIIPMAALSAVLFGVSSKTADYRMLAMIFLQRISLQESAVAIVVTVVTVVQNLAIGAASGFAAALVFFMWNMARGRVQMTPLYHNASYELEREGEEGTPAVDEVTAGDTQTHTRERDCFSEFSPREAEEDVDVHISSQDVSDADENERIDNRSFLSVNLLDVQTDPVFKEVKVLRVKVQGVLFFGSCMSFVDCVTQLLHNHHNEIFLKVTDIILDFQHGMMTVMDFSACEAIQDAGKIFLKRGIRTHVQNMDPLSYTCFERCRRYFDDVVEDDPNNTKHICYVRRIFKRSTDISADGGEVVQHGGDVLDEDVFLRADHSIYYTTTSNQVTPTSAMEPAKETEEGVPTKEEEGEAQVQFSCREVKLSLEDSVKVGFSVYRPRFGISVVVFDTTAGWKRRLQSEEATGRVLSLELGITDATPFNRQFGDVSKLWWKRLFNKDVPRASNTQPPREHEDGEHRRPGPLRRPPPTVFLQLPRFPGQGFSKREHLSTREWNLIRLGVYEKLYDQEPPPTTRNKFVIRMKKLKDDLVDGFI
ncbi:Sulfate permease family, putative [Angomonas deanei]|uniref:Sulfate permease family, putative n=1 Tax=Angomonas deanei TaxID=59799 RepID=A0A7G2CI99_9TRYP|nr:Sulfate permease family, putative [Angomonas deanei]